MSDRISVLKPGRVVFARLRLLEGVVSVAKTTITGAIIKSDGSVLYDLKGYGYRVQLEQLFNSPEEAFADEVK